MSERGKYYGQRLKAKDVLRLYAAGERDFRGIILRNDYFWQRDLREVNFCDSDLRGCDFRWTDLSGSNIQNSDIRGTIFFETNLSEVNFTKAIGGKKKRVFLPQTALIAWIIALMCLSSIAIIQSYTNHFMLPQYVTYYDVRLYELLAIAMGLICSAIIIRKGFSGMTTLLSVLMGSILGISLAKILGVDYGLGIIAVSGILITFLGGFYDILIRRDSSTIFPFVFPVVISFTVLFSAIVSFGTTFFIVFVTKFPSDSDDLFVMSGDAVGIACALTLLCFLYMVFRVLEGDSDFIWIAKLMKSFASHAGTSFRGSFLRNVKFTYADLKNVDFSNSVNNVTNLTRVRWKAVQGLEYCHLEDPILEDRRIRNLLITLDGVDQDLSDADLRDMNLAGATLHRIDLKGANLNGATLEGAELHGANLTNAQCVGTDFTRAHLTGACLEAWNIDGTTILKDIDCEYVFLKAEPDAQGNRERRPHNPDKVFQPGDFEKFFKEMLDTVQILIRQGIHPQVFRDTLAQLMADYHLPDDAVQGYERKGEDVLITVAVPPGTNKGQFEQDFDELQALKLEAARAQGLLEGERKRADDLKAIMLSLGPAASNVTVTTTAMTNSNNPNISAADGSFVNTGDNLQGNVINLGEISGQVSNQINQLPETAPSADQRSLKDLLKDLQAAIVAETELSDIEKKEALGEVGKLAEAGTKPQENAMQRMAKRATANLKAIAEPLTEASNLVTVCKSLLPLILALFV
jgi:uncharacterized protein YjbI with pentapeptide repeats